jgi:NAD+ kinase
MNDQFRTVAVVGRSQDMRVAEPMALLAGYLNQAGVTVITTAGTPAELPARQVDEAAIGQEADLIIAVGGDGTMLHAATLALDDDVPLLGVNRGRLGFLADITPDEMLERVGQILAGHYTSESRMMLEASIRHADGREFAATGLNDVAVQRHGTGRMLDIRTSIDDRFVNTHSGDGLIVATPTGSTAYALSCGGPIIEPGMDSVVIVPICPHTLSDRPIVVPAGREIQVRLLERLDIRAEVMVDGHSLGELTPDDRLIIAKSPRRVTLIHPPGYDFYGILRSKLHWGRDNRLLDIGAQEE